MKSNYSQLIRKIYLSLIYSFIDLWVFLFYSKSLLKTHGIEERLYPSMFENWVYEINRQINRRNSVHIY